MERLTERVGGYVHINVCSTLYSDKERKRDYLYNAIVRLAEYEDLGSIERLRELVEAEREGRCVVAGMHDKCKTCVHNMDKSNLDCEYACAGVSETDGNGIVFACDDYKATQQGCGNG